MEENKKEDWGVTCKHCGKEVESWRTYCPNCNKKIRSDSEIKSNLHTISLNICANLMLILGILSTIAIFINFSTIKVLKSSSTLYTPIYDTQINWYGILGGIGMLLATFTVYYLCKTVIDIYNK